MNRTGVRQLAGTATAYLACLTFALTFLLASMAGAASSTALLRGVVVAVITYVLGRPLLGPSLATLLEAMAKDRSGRKIGEDAK